MSLSRRKFLSTVAAAGGAAITSSRALAAPYQGSIHGSSHSIATGPPMPGVCVTIPSTMPIGSGAPLGGIGTGFVEIRSDGCFYEWQIFNSGPWAQYAKSTTRPPMPGPQYLRFVLRTANAGCTPQVRRLYLRSDENEVYSPPDAAGCRVHRVLCAIPNDRAAISRLDIACEDNSTYLFAHDSWPSPRISYARLSRGIHCRKHEQEKDRGYACRIHGQPARIGACRP